MAYNVAIFRRGMAPKAYQCRDPNVGNAEAFAALINANVGKYLTFYSLSVDADAPYISAGQNGGVDTWNGGGVPEQIFIGEGVHFRSMQWDQNSNPV